MSNFFKDETIRALASSEDQAATIFDMVKNDLEHQILMSNDVIIAVFIEREMSPGGLLLPPERLKESIYQSKVGLVIAHGPDAFRFRGSYPWVSPLKSEIKKDGSYTPAYYKRAEKYTPKIGDWVVHFPSDSRVFGLGGVPCRYSLDSTVKMRSTKPASIL